MRFLELRFIVNDAGGWASIVWNLKEKTVTVDHLILNILRLESL